MNSETSGQTIDPDVVAHDEPPHQDLCCLQIQLLLSLVLKLLTFIYLLKTMDED